MKEYFSKIVNPENLYLAWEKIKAISKDEYMFNDYEIRYYNENIDNVIKIINYELENNILKFDIFHAFETPKKNGKRLFHINSIKNMIVIQSILNIIGPEFEKGFIAQSYGYRISFDDKKSVYKKWSSQYQEFSSILEKWYEKYKLQEYVILKYDIKGFFDNVRIDKLLDMLKSKISDIKIIGLLEKYFYTQHLNGDLLEVVSGLPQGIHSSGFLANIFLNDFDKVIKENTLGYARYVDDLFILIEKKNKDFVKDLIWKELNNLSLEPNYDKYNEIDIDDYYTLQDEKNKIKYETINFLDEQVESLTEKEKENIFQVIEGRLIELQNSDLKIDDLKSYSDQINYLLFLSNRLCKSNKDLILLALKVLEREAIKYSKLDRIYHNLFLVNGEGDFIFDNMENFPDYIKLSLAKYLLINNYSEYSTKFVDSYLSSNNYLLITCGIMLAKRINLKINTSDIIESIDNDQQNAFLLNYYLTMYTYEFDADINSDFVIKYFNLIPSKFLLYIYNTNNKNLLDNLLYQGQLDKCEINSLIYLVKTIFRISNPKLYEFIVQKFESDLEISIFKKEILYYTNSPQENKEYNIESLIQLYRLIECQIDDLSIHLINELVFYIKDTQIVIGKEYIDFGKLDNSFLLDINYEQKILTIYTTSSDIQYYYITYQDKKYLLEKSGKGVFESREDFIFYRKTLNLLYKNNLINKVIVKNFRDYQYVFALYEINNYHDLLSSKFQKNEGVNLYELKLILNEANKFNKISGVEPIFSSFNILIENSKPKFIGVLSQIKYNMYESVCNNRRNINVNRVVESFGYLFIENFFPNNFLYAISNKDYLSLFHLPHISNILRKIRSDNTDYTYKSTKLLEDDLLLIINFSNFLDSINEDEQTKKIITSLDYLCFRFIQYKRYLDNSFSSIVTISQGIEIIIEDFNNYLYSLSICLKQYKVLNRAYKFKLEKNKLNRYSSSLILFLITIFKNFIPYIHKYSTKYDFNRFALFANYVIEIYELQYESYIRHLLNNEIAATTLTSDDSSYIIWRFNEATGADTISNYDLTENTWVLDNILSMITNNLLKINEDKIDHRKYGKLLICGTIFDEQNKDIYVQENFHRKKIKIKYEAVDKIHRQYIRYTNNPEVSFDQLNNHIFNINIESRSVKKFFEITKRNKKQHRKRIIIDKLIAFIFLIIWSLLLGLFYLLNVKIGKLGWFGGAFSYVLSVCAASIYKEAIKKNITNVITKVNNSVKKLFSSRV